MVAQRHGEAPSTGLYPRPRLRLRPRLLALRLRLRLRLRRLRRLRHPRLRLHPLALFRLGAGFGNTRLGPGTLLSLSRLFCRPLDLDVAQQPPARRRLPRGHATHLSGQLDP